MTTRKVLGVILVGTALYAADAAATDVLDASALGMGGTATAHPQNNATITVNPAALGLVDRYDVQSLFQLGPSTDRRWNASAVDSQTNSFMAFGFVYNGGKTTPDLLPSELPGWVPTGSDPDNLRKSHDLTAALAFPFLDRRLSLGINGTVSFFQGENVGRGTTGNVDVGLAARPIDGLTLGVVGRDVLPIGGQGDRPAALTAGFRAGREDLLIAAADAAWRFEDVQGNPMDVRAGVQGQWSAVAARTGWMWDGDRDQHHVTWGLGLHNDAGTIGYAMQVPVGGASGLANALHTVSITLHTAAMKPEPIPSATGFSRR